MRPGHIVVSALVAMLGLAAVFVAQHWLDQSSRSNLAPDRPTAVDLLAKKVEESFQAIESRRGYDNPVLRFNGAQALDTEAMSFDPNARVDVIRGMSRQNHRIPNQDGDAEAEVTGPDAKVEVEADPVAAVVDDGMRAMSISISDVHEVTGFVLPGDHVDIMLTRDQYTDILLQNIKVLAIDHLANERADKSKSGRTATVEVNTVDAQKLISAQTAGTLSLALRASGPGQAQPIDGFCGCRPNCVNRSIAFAAVICRSQEFRGTQPIDTEAVPFDPNARVGAIRGMSRQEYDVPKHADESEEKTAVELMTMKMVETFQAIMESLWDVAGWSKASQASTSGHSHGRQE